MLRLSDLAREMGVSVATVSNAFTGRGRMKEETRLEIRRRAAEMGYIRPERTPDAAGGCLIAAEEIDSPFVSRMLRGLSAQAAEEEMTLPIFCLDMRDEPSLYNPGVEGLNRRLTALMSVLHRPVRGMIYLSRYARRIQGLLPQADFPIVSLFCTREEGQPFVHYDDRQGAYAAVNALIRSGCRRVAMLSGPIDSIGMFYRTTGYQRALIDSGLSCDPALMRVGDWNRRSGYELTHALLKENREIDAIFAQNDHMDSLRRLYTQYYQFGNLIIYFST